MLFQGLNFARVQIYADLYAAQFHVKFHVMKVKKKETKQNLLVQITDLVLDKLQLYLLSAGEAL